jgi:hypothetical protein
MQMLPPSATDSSVARFFRFKPRRAARRSSALCTIASRPVSASESHGMQTTSLHPAGAGPLWQLELAGGQPLKLAGNALVDRRNTLQERMTAVRPAQGRFYQTKGQMIRQAVIKTDRNRRRSESLHRRAHLLHIGTCVQKRQARMTVTNHYNTARHRKRQVLDPIGMAGSTANALPPRTWRWADACAYRARSCAVLF